MSREEAIDIIRSSMIQIGRCNGKLIFTDAINTLLDTERKTGKWIHKPDPYGFFDTIPVCSECGCTTKMRETYKFCPHCGARMEVGE